MKKTLFIKNAAILTASGLALRFIGIIFKVWVSKVIGATGVGLYQMIFSVYVFASTFATSGICTAVTRLVSESFARKRKEYTEKYVTVALKITLVIAFLSFLILFFFSKIIAKQIIGDVLAAESIRVFSLSLFFMGGCSCFRGYFIAVSKVTPTATVQIFEQIIRISVIFVSLYTYAKNNLYLSCVSLFIGDTVSEIFGFLVLLGLYRRDFKKRIGHIGSVTSLPTSLALRQTLRIAAPISLSRYLNSFLRTAENILTPKLLNLFYLNYNTSLSLFGMIKGMALPILLFPSTLLNSVSTLLIPEIARESALNRKGVVKSLCEKVIRITSVLGIFCGNLFLFCGERLGIILYGNHTVGNILKLLSVIVPVMYVDSVCDGLLKGLDQQNFSFKVTVSDSTLRILLIFIFLRYFGIMGFIGIMYFSNLYTGILNFTRLKKKTDTKIDLLRCVFIPFLSSFGILFCVTSFLKFIPTMPDLVYIILVAVFSAAAYILLMLKAKILVIGDIKDIV